MEAAKKEGAEVPAADAAATATATAADKQEQVRAAGLTGVVCMHHASLAPDWGVKI